MGGLQAGHEELNAWRCHTPFPEAIPTRGRAGGFAGSHFLFAPTIGYDELAAIEASYIRKTN